MAKKKKTKPTEKLSIENHILVPKHEKCPETEKKTMLSRHNITVHDLPKISINDPAIYDMDIKPGDVIKITRESPTAGKHTFYRVVIEI